MAGMGEADASAEGRGRSEALDDRAAEDATAASDVGADDAARLASSAAAAAAAAAAEEGGAPSSSGEMTASSSSAGSGHDVYVEASAPDNAPEKGRAESSEIGDASCEENCNAGGDDMDETLDRGGAAGSEDSAGSSADEEEVIILPTFSDDPIIIPPKSKQTKAEPIDEGEDVSAAGGDDQLKDEVLGEQSAKDGSDDAMMEPSELEEDDATAVSESENSESDDSVEGDGPGSEEFASSESDREELAGSDVVEDGSSASHGSDNSEAKGAQTDQSGKERRPDESSSTQKADHDQQSEVSEEGAQNDTNATGGESSKDGLGEGAPRQVKLVDYASKAAGAQILEQSPSMKGASNLLTGDKDKYSIAPCEDKKYVVVGLSEDILVKQIKLSNYERYSSRVREFQVLASQEYPTPNEEYWNLIGTYESHSRSGEQSFELEEPAWARYLKFRFLGHYGSEHYCTLTQIKVHGSTMLQGFHEQWIESEKKDRAMEGKGEDATEKDGEDDEAEEAGADDDESRNVEPGEGDDEVGEEEETEDATSEGSSDAEDDADEDPATAEPVDDEESADVDSSAEQGDDQGDGEHESTSTEKAEIVTQNEEGVQDDTQEAEGQVDEEEELTAVEEKPDGKDVSPRPIDAKQAAYDDESDHDHVREPEELAKDAESKGRSDALDAEPAASSNDLEVQVIGGQEKVSGGKKDHVVAQDSGDVEIKEAITEESTAMRDDSSILAMTDAVKAASDAIKNATSDAIKAIRTTVSSAKTGEPEKDGSRPSVEGALSDDAKDAGRESKPHASVATKEGTRSTDSQPKSEQPKKNDGTPEIDAKESSTKSDTASVPIDKRKTEKGPATPKVETKVTDKQKPEKGPVASKEEIKPTEKRKSEKGHPMQKEESKATDKRKPEKGPATPKEETKPADKRKTEKGPASIKGESKPTSSRDMLRREPITHTGKDGQELDASASELYAKLSRRFAHASCMKDLDFHAFKSKTMLANAGNGGPVGAGAKMEPIFAKITTEIKTVQITQNQYEQYISALKACYENLFWDVAKDLDTMQTSFDQRLASLERSVFLNEMRMKGSRSPQRSKMSQLFSTLPVAVSAFQFPAMPAMKEEHFQIVYASIGTFFVLFFLRRLFRRRSLKVSVSHGDNFNRDLCQTANPANHAASNNTSAPNPPGTLNPPSTLTSTLVPELTSANDLLERELNHAKGQLAEKDQKLNNLLERELDDAKGQLAEKDERLKSIETQHTTLEKDYASLQERYSELEQRISQMETATPSRDFKHHVISYGESACTTPTPSVQSEPASSEVPRMPTTSKLGSPLKVKFRKSKSTGKK